MQLSIFLLIGILNVIGKTSGNPRRKRAESGLVAKYLEAGQRSRLKSHLQKREAEGDVANFVLKLNPFIPRYPMYLRNFTNMGCVDRKQWCIENPPDQPSQCPPVDTPTPKPRTCGPTRTKVLEFRHTICNYEASHIPQHRDLCEECSTTPSRGSTPFVACYSVPPPTKALRLKYCNPTYITCHMIPCTFRVAEQPTTEAPPTPPSCDVSQSPLEGSDRDRRQAPNLQRYYILVKRSPGTWKRRRRNLPGRRYRIVSQFK